MKEFELVMLGILIAAIPIGIIFFCISNYLKKILEPLTSLVKGKCRIKLVISAGLKGLYNGKKVEIKTAWQRFNSPISIEFSYKSPLFFTIYPNNDNRFKVVWIKPGFIGKSVEITEDKIDSSDFPLKDFFVSERRQAIVFLFNKGFTYIQLTGKYLKVGNKRKLSLLPLTQLDKDILKPAVMRRILDNIMTLII